MSLKERVYICSWDCEGFEAIVDCTSWERRALLDNIAGKNPESPPVNLHALMLRARFNPQRSPEIWSFSTTEEITEADLRKIAENNPQCLVDLIRKNGNCLYRTAPNKRVIE